MSTPRRGRRKADIREPTRILVMVDGEILALPIGERSGSRRHLDIQHPADDDGVRMPLDDILDLAVDSGQRIDQQRYAGCPAEPLRTGKAAGALGAILAGEAL